MKTLRPYPRATITPKGEHALEKGHPWVYEAEVVSLEPAPGEAAVANGSIVDVVSRKGSYLGSGCPRRVRFAFASSPAMRTIASTVPFGSGRCSGRGITGKR